MHKIIRIGTATSNRVQATRGITAGSGLATFEMRLVMIRLVDRAVHVSPWAQPTLYVDDLSVEAAGTEEEVVEQISIFGYSACGDIEADGGEVSRTKSVCTASSTEIGQEIQRRMAKTRKMTTKRMTPGCSTCISLSDHYFQFLMAAPFFHVDKGVVSGTEYYANPLYDRW